MDRYGCLCKCTCTNIVFCCVCGKLVMYTCMWCSTHGLSLHPPHPMPTATSPDPPTRTMSDIAASLKALVPWQQALLACWLRRQVLKKMQRHKGEEEEHGGGTRGRNKEGRVCGVGKGGGGDAWW